MPSNKARLSDGHLQCIERMTGRYGGIINPVVQALLLPDLSYPAGSVLRTLADRGRVTIHKRRLPGGRNWVTLSPVALRDHGLPKNRAETSALALEDAVSNLVFCFLARDNKRRHLLETQEASSLLRTTLPNNVYHVITREFGTPVVLRIFRYTADSPAQALPRLQDYADKASLQWPTWTRDGDYGFAVLCPTKEAHRDFIGGLNRSGLKEAIRVSAYHVPNVEHLNAYLKRKVNRDVSRTPEELE